MNFKLIIHPNFVAPIKEAMKLEPHEDLPDWIITDKHVEENVFFKFDPKLLDEPKQLPIYQPYIPDTSAWDFRA